jgi:hypothetical protein
MPLSSTMTVSAVDLRAKAAAPAREARNLPEVGEELFHLAPETVDRVSGHGLDGSGALLLDRGASDH